ncbi:MAG: insulinase family protein [Thermoanaerobaculia bacterium]
MACRVAAIDLSAARETRLDNGLTMLVLEDRTMPVVSVQMLYRAGARDERPGTTGVAHFMEHMAFRASEGFPETRLASSIYEVGGEWHAYTWIDQTTYYETAPREALDLLLRVEADRMARLLLPADEVEAERGAVLAELHGYENDPASVLYDAVLATSFLQHPYRYNTIGWESDVESLDRQDLLGFYRRHYVPANAVLAIAGDVEADAVEGRVRELFGALAAGEPTPPPRTREPEQRGARRLELPNGDDARRFCIAWRAPAVTDAEWPAFLLLRELLGGSDGINFQQEEFGVPVAPGTRLAGLPADATTFFIPTADPYVLTVAGVLSDGAEPAVLEDTLEATVGALRERLVPDEELTAARERLLTALLFDVQTTEDAAHQLAYYGGLGALDVLRGLSTRLAEITPEDVRSAARHWLAPEGRTVGWSVPTEAPEPGPVAAGGAGTSRERIGGEVASPDEKRPDSGDEADAESSAGAGRTDRSSRRGSAAPRDAGPLAGEAGERLGAPVAVRLSAGLPGLVQRIPECGTVFVGVLFPGDVVADHEEPDVTTEGWPAWRHTWWGWRGRAGEVGALVARARAAVSGASASPPDGGEAGDDPESRVEASLREQLGIAATAGDASPVLVIVAGDVDAAEVKAILEHTFGPVSPGLLADTPPPRVKTPAVALRADRPFAQTRLGWAVPAPGTRSDEALSWRLLLWVLTHGYEGRLGVEAISHRGLLYWIASAYHSDGANGWIELSMGVDPEKLDALRATLRETLAGLAADPPSEAEIAAARKALLGRRVSAAQSPEEVAAFLAGEWTEQGRIRTVGELRDALRAVSRDDVLAAIAPFLAGATAWLEIPDPRPAPRS